MRSAPPRFPSPLPRGPELWYPERTLWTEENTDGLDACALIEGKLRLSKGRSRGELVRLRHWQGDMICDALRRDVDTGLRVYRTYLFFVPRKNSKSLLGSGLAIDGLFDEGGAEVYSVAGSRDQARIVFKEVRSAVEMDPELLKWLKVYKDAIECPAFGSVYRVLSSDAGLQEGLNPSRVLFDELHTQPHAELWNVMNQGSDTREQPLVLAISTFGKMLDSRGQESVAYSEYKRLHRIMSGELKDPNYGGRIYETTTTTTDHMDPKSWEESNPALGDFLIVGNMVASARKMPESDFRNKRMNQWQSGSAGWLPFGTWASRQAATARALERGLRVVIGFDGSWSNDSTALIGATVEDDPHIFEISCWERTPNDPATWRVPISEVEEEIETQCARLEVLEVTCDPSRWQRTIDMLAQKGVPMTEFPQTPARLVPACQEFFERVTAGPGEPTLTHDGSPGLARHIGAAVIKSDRIGTRIVKETKDSPLKVDRAIAAVMALSRALHHNQEAKKQKRKHIY